MDAAPHESQDIVPDMVELMMEGTGGGDQYGGAMSEESRPVIGVCCSPCSPCVRS